MSKRVFNQMPMMGMIGLCVSFVLSSAEARREHKAHVHGKGELSIAFEGLTGEIEFEVPAESVYGFEHTPKTEDEKRAVDEALLGIEQNIGKALVFDPSLECRLSKKKIEREQHKGDHANVEGEFTVICQKEPTGSSVQVDPAQIFPKIKSLKVVYIVGESQKSLQVKGKTGIQLK